MKKISLVLLILIIVGIFIPAVSASVIVDEHINTYEFTGGQSKYPAVGPKPVTPWVFDRLYFTDISKANDLQYIVVECKQGHQDWVNLSQGVHSIEYTLNGVNNTGRIHVDKSYNFLGELTHQRVTLFFDNWNIGTLYGPQTVTFTPSIGSIYTYDHETTYRPIGDSIVELPDYRLWQFPYTITICCGQLFKQHIIIDAISDYDINVIVDRSIDGAYFASNVSIYDVDGAVIFKDESQNDINLNFLSSIIDTVRITNLDTVYTYPITSSAVDPDDPNVIVYVKNSQTGALIADANIVIDALVNDEYYPVVNRTEPSGIFSITLQPTGGGQPNPDGYRLIATADGYNNPMPEINFTVDDYKIAIYCLLDPIAGGPENENKTFIDFFVRDMSSNPISGATVKFGKYTLITNSQGYTVFEVDKNNNYSWTVSKSGYGSLTGNAVIGDDPRHTINTVLAPAVTPTTTTPIPTSPSIGPTPTMTAPTGEPVSNWLEWFAAHFGMILGGGVEIGKIFMWLCFTVPVGVYVGKEAKAGAAGFMAGAGIVTLFFVLIGWVPIWLVVLLALIIGLLYAKVFNTPDNGGGR